MKMWLDQRYRRAVYFLWRQRFRRTGAWFLLAKLRWHMGLSAAERCRLGLRVDEETIRRHERREGVQ